MSDEGDAGARPADELGKEAKVPGPAEPQAAGPDGARPDEARPDGARPDGKDRKAAAEDDSATARESTEQLTGLGNNFYNYSFHGSVNASHGIFGPSDDPNADETSRRTRTGRLPQDETAALCEHFAQPSLFLAAAEALDRDRVIVLAGAGGLGKRTSALRLLLDAGAETLEVVSPTLTLEDLSKEDFETGHGYLVEDWQQAPRTGTSDYNWLMLREHIKDSGIRLVITTAAGRAGRSVTQFAWQPPTAEQVLTAYLTDGEAGVPADRIAAITEIAWRIPDTYPDAFSVGAVAAIGRRLADGNCSPEIRQEILRELSSDPGRYVREWLSADERTDDEIQRVTALCFAAGRSERVFGVMVMRLEATLGDSGLLAEPETGKGASDDGDPAEAPKAARRSSGLGGLRRKPTGLLEREGGRVRFQGKEAQQYLYHRHTVHELWHGYDMKFWIAIRDWLAEVIGDTTIRDVQVSVAAGLTMLAFTALDEVEGSYLHPWADGELTWSGQCTAVYVLWLMSRDDTLSPIALRIATDWVNSGNPVRQWTAAAALSGELGAAYPATAAARLWHLVGQWRDVPIKAVIALAGLFATLTMEREGQEAHQVLELLKDRMDRASGRGEGEAGGEGTRGPEGTRAIPSASWRDDRRNKERGMLCILEVLAVRDPLTKHPSITSFLNARPEHQGLVAELWSVVLRNRPFRKRALVALLDAVRGFEYVSDDPEGAARSLGDALTDELPASEHRPLSMDFTSIVARSKQQKGDTTATVKALMNAFEHLKPRERTAE